MSNRIQFRRDTPARWTSVNPILQEGELGLETDTRFCKIGDGVHAWNDLGYATAFHNITHELGTADNLVLSQKGAKIALDNLKTDIDTDITDTNDKIDNFIKQHSGIQPFNDIVQTADILMSSTTAANGDIIYVVSAKKFAYLSGGKYYSNWTSSPSADKYLDNTRSAILTDRLYVCQGKLYFWDGTDLVAVKDNLSQVRGNREDIAMSQKAVTDNLVEIEKTVWPLSIFFDINPQSDEYTGSNKNVTIIWNIFRKGEIIDNSKLSVLRITKDSEEITVNKTASGSVTTTANGLDDIIFEIYVEADGLVDGAGISYHQFSPIYVGFSTAEDRNACTKYSKENPAGTYTLTNSTKGNLFWIFFPESKSINRVTLNGFDVPMIFSGKYQTSNGDFKVYRSANGFEAKTFTFRVE